MKQQMQLSIDGIECNAIIGCHGYERNEAQPVSVDLKLMLSNEVTYNDEILNTVNYSEVSDYIQELVAASHFRLLETLAIFLAEELLKKYPIINCVTVNLSKPNVNGKKARHIECSFTMPRLYKVALALGSNMNNPFQQLITATELLLEVLSNVKTASIYKSAPQGFSEQEDFYNTCISGYTDLTPDYLLIEIKKLEKLMGKVEKFTNGPRVIDIDIIFFDQQSYKNLYLQIPHKSMATRDFVLKPLAEIEPDWMHPELNLSVTQLVERLNPQEQFILERVN